MAVAGVLGSIWGGIALQNPGWTAFGTALVVLIIVLANNHAVSRELPDKLDKITSELGSIRENAGTITNLLQALVSGMLAAGLTKETRHE